VLTGVEDFMKDHPGEYRYLMLTDQHGLGVLHRKGSVSDSLPWMRIFARLQRRKAMSRIRAGAGRLFGSARRGRG